jgi:hypothetical protein
LFSIASSLAYSIACFSLILLSAIVLLSALCAPFLLTGFCDLTRSDALFVGPAVAFLTSLLFYGVYTG